MNAQLSKQCVNGAHLYALPPAGVSQLGCVNVVLPVRYDQGECGEPLHDGIPSFRARKTLKQFLEDHPGDGLCAVAAQVPKARVVKK